MRGRERKREIDREKERERKDSERERVRGGESERGGCFSDDGREVGLLVNRGILPTNSRVSSPRSWRFRSVLQLLAGCCCCCCCCCCYCCVNKISQCTGMSSTAAVPLAKLKEANRGNTGAPQASLSQLVIAREFEGTPA